MVSKDITKIIPTTLIFSTIVKATKDKEDDMMSAMRNQSMYFMPLITLFIGWNFSLGLLLYWFLTSLLMVVQQLVVNKTNKK